MDADNFVGPCSPAVGCYDGWVAVVNGVVIGPFLSQAEAERAYRAARGELAPEPVTIPVSYPEVTLSCSNGEGAPVNGGCWCCIDGQWATDPKFCSDPTWRVRCGNDGSGAVGSTRPPPQKGAPTSPESSLPPIVAPGGQTAQQTTPARVLDVDAIAGALHVSRREVYVLAGIAAAVLVLR